VISWFVQRENQEKILEKGLPDALELVEKEVLFLE
jgi:molybdate transport system ATP-binding protein